MSSIGSQPPLDWTNMTVSDWLDVTPGEWMDRAMPGWRERTVGDYLQAPQNWWMSLYPGAQAPGGAASARGAPAQAMGWPFAPGAGAAWAPGAWSRPGPGGWSRPGPGGWPATGSRRHRHHEGHCDCGCGCGGRHHRHRHRHHHFEHRRGPCECDCCECHCCVGDADLLVPARLGETRVVPIEVANQRRREATIALELSDWSTRGGKAAPVTTVSLEPREFTLGACAERLVTLTVHTGGQEPTPTPTPTPQPTPDPNPKLAADTAVIERVPDVDECQVAFADLRLIGCEHRAVHIAVAILPRSCDPAWIACGCACC